MPHRRATRGWVLALACWAGASVAGDGTAKDALRACAALQVDTERLACYDREVPRLLSAPTTKAPTSAAAVDAATAAPGPTPEQKFGLPMEKLNEKYPAPKESAPMRDMTAHVLHSTRLPSGNFLIELDNDQVWWQIDTD